MDQQELLDLIETAACEDWTELDLSFNQLTTLPPEIGQLAQLQELDLSGNGLTTLPPEIGQLSQLYKLHLHFNRLTMLPLEIVPLTQLQELNLSGNGLMTLPPEIALLSQLQSLDLSGNQLTTLPQEMERLSHLRSFDLRSNQLTAIPPQIGQLSQLQELNLRGNQLTILPPEIGKLSHLQSLDIGGSYLKTLPPEIGQLSQLQSLDLTGNQLTVLIPEIGQLSRLQSLDLTANQLTVLIPEIGQLSQLQSLGLGENQLKALPPEIGQLTGLRSLDISENQLTTLPPQIGQLSHLQSLYLRYNRLRALPPEIGKLSQLQWLDLGRNQLVMLPPEIGKLSQLQSLDLSGNQMMVLPREIEQLTQLQRLDLRENPFPVPPEILAQTDEAQTIIRTYLDFLTGQSHPLNEVKMVLVGQGSVGKTSLVNRLLDDAFDPHEAKTEGISIRRWSIPISDSQSTDLRINVWDFGGQEVMHATHQFFLTRRTLYLLVLDARLNEAENRLDYWLQIVQSFGGNSPIIVVGNKVDQQPLDIDRGGLQAKYPFVKAIVETSCTTGQGIAKLRATIASQIPALPHVFDELLATWFDVKAQLEDMDADYIPYTQYVQICQGADVTEERSQRTLLGFLHDLGIVLHFPDPRLETTNILNPEWVTQGVYRILNSHALFQNGGVLTWEMLTQILGSKEYPRDKHIFIVDMMRKFELCYPFPGQDHTYLIPDLLPKEERFTGEWNDALAFQVHYNILPSSIISRFIVRMHRTIHQNTVWRTGVLLISDDNHALVKADYTEDRITISVRGPAYGRRELLTRIREQLDVIHYTITGLQVEEKVPIPGHPELPPVDYQYLRDLESLGEETFIPPGLRMRISVRQLLDGVDPPTRRTRRDGPTYNIDARGAQIGTIGDDAEIQDGIHFESDKD